MKTTAYALLVCAFCLLQATWLNALKVFSVKPDLLLITMIIATLNFKPGKAMALSVYTGVLKDIFSPFPVGLHTLLFPLWSLFIIALSKKIVIDGTLLYSVLAALVVILQSIGARIVLVFLGETMPPGVFLRIMILGALYTAFAMPVIWKLLKPLIEYRDAEDTIF
ncbi:MAG: rod shape-determining protein MreD [Candidatus Omnitrophica bacterium]|nr:rod shape-determining protein MreD [Candidatus Omnitrophota bacterium]